VAQFAAPLKIVKDLRDFQTFDAMETGKPKLIFVYNAKSGVFNLLTDVAHKIFSPETYACNLCALTHGNFGMKREWKKFLNGLGASLEFLHADEFKRKYKDGEIKLPAILKLENDTPVLLVDARTINECRSIGDLKEHIEARFKPIVVAPHIRRDRF
jgi:hypothetical protein